MITISYSGAFVSYSEGFEIVVLLASMAAALRCQGTMTLSSGSGSLGQ